MGLRFSKMQGAGNDFVVFDTITQKADLTPETIRRLADRRFGIGADQVLVVSAPDTPDTDFVYRIFNCDGGEVEQCGNGARCFARFVFGHGLTRKRAIRVRTMKGVIEPRLEDDGRVTVDMGAPRFAPEDLPFVPEGLQTRRQADDLLHGIPACGALWFASTVSMGNPHAVLVVDDPASAPVETVGPAIENAVSVFPRRVNVGFLARDNEREGRLRVWERGAGETLACGTGACAAAVAGIRRGLFRGPVELHARGGDLRIAWDGTAAGHVFLTGPAVEVFTGEIPL